MGYLLTWWEAATFAVLGARTAGRSERYAEAVRLGVRRTAVMAWPSTVST